VQLPQRMPYSGAPLVRVLARMTQTGVPASDVTLLDRLSQWLGWTDAIALSSALDAGAQASGASAGSAVYVTAAPGSGGDATIATLEAALCARTRATLSDAIRAIDAADGGWRGANARRGVTTQLRAQSHVQSHAHLRTHLGTHVITAANVETRGNAGAETVDFALFRQVYHTQQQSMEHAIGELRVRLRATLATRSERHARLALVDATMERALDARERSVLAALPALLEAYFKRLRDAAQAREEAEAAAPKPAGAQTPTETASAASTPSRESTAADAATVSEAVAAVSAPQAQDAAAPRATQAIAAPRVNAWLDTFREDMRAVLLAELEVRFQPVEGLLAALRAS
jgi:hypothetical protein